MSMVAFSAFERAGKLQEMTQYKLSLNAVRNAHAERNAYASLHASIADYEDSVMFDSDVDLDTMVGSALSSKFGKSVGALTSDAMHASVGIQPMNEADLAGLPENIRFMIENAAELSKLQGAKE